MKSQRLKFIVFSIIGIFNTFFDIALYFVIYNASKSIIIANLLATSAALVGSYLLNSKLTFKTKQWTAKSFIGFVVVTVFGLWVLQTAAIYGLTHLLKSVPENLWQHLGSFETSAKTLIPKLLATVITFVWNYLWYNKVIFKNEHPEQNALLSLDDL